MDSPTEKPNESGGGGRGLWEGSDKSSVVMDMEDSNDAERDAGARENNGQQAKDVEISPRGRDRRADMHDSRSDRGERHQRDHHQRRPSNGREGHDVDGPRMREGGRANDRLDPVPRTDATQGDELITVSADKTNIIYATNISPVVTLEQMETFFGILGDIRNISMYHFDNSPEANFQVCFVEFAKHSSVSMALHLTNTIFIDRAIFVLPYDKSRIPPDKETAEELGYNRSEYVTNFNPEVSTQVTSGPGGAQVITTSDSRLTAASLQQYPQLPINTDPTRIEEIRRTLYIGNLDSSQNPEQTLKFFNDIGEVKYIRVAGDETQPTRFAFVEFTHQSSVANALLHNGFVFGSRALKINHSNNPIVKPQHKLEIEDPSKSRMLDSRSRDGRGDNRHGGHKRDRRGQDRYYDRRMSPRDRRSGRSRSRERYARSRRSRSRDRSSRRSRSRDEIPRRRSRSRDSRKRRSRSRSSERRSKHKSSRRH